MSGFGQFSCRHRRSALWESETTESIKCKTLPCWCLSPVGDVAEDNAKHLNLQVFLVVGDVLASPLQVHGGCLSAQTSAAHATGTPTKQEAYQYSVKQEFNEKRKTNHGSLLNSGTRFSKLKL